MDYVTLSDGVKMPQLGFGVYQVMPDECERCVLDALEAGYRSIDTAYVYFNEKEVGNAIRKSGVPREDIFLTTKVWIGNYGEKESREAVLSSMERLQTSYLDLVLLHHPYGDVYGAWRALEALRDEGKIRAIGVSNFLPYRLAEFCSFTKTPPVLNQVETHPLYQQTESLAWMKKYNVQPEAWAPFGEGRGGLFTNPVLTEIGAQYGKTAAQVMLRWNLQRGVVVIPRSSKKERIRENLDVFDFALSDADMAKIAGLDTGKTSFFMPDDPKQVEWFVHMVEVRSKQQDPWKERQTRSW